MSQTTDHKRKDIQMTYLPETTETTLRTGTIEVDGLNIFYREVGKPGSPKLVLLHGFPASSHQLSQPYASAGPQVPRHRHGLPRLRQ